MLISFSAAMTRAFRAMPTSADAKMTGERDLSTPLILSFADSHQGWHAIRVRAYRRFSTGEQAGRCHASAHDFQEPIMLDADAFFDRPRPTELPPQYDAKSA